MKCDKCGVSSSQYLSEEKFINVQSDDGEKHYCPYCYELIQNVDDTYFAITEQNEKAKYEKLNNQIMMTTTNGFENHLISKYIGVVSSRMVASTSIFTDLSASFQDIIGGRSPQIEKALQILEKNAVMELESKAQSLGANAIIGYKSDIDEISGKNMQMFMISVYGTAVFISENKLENQ